jgi:diketogulonate reductase-like aldo/keto reductase
MLLAVIICLWYLVVNYHHIKTQAEKICCWGINSFFGFFKREELVVITKVMLSKAPEKVTPTFLENKLKKLFNAY